MTELAILYSKIMRHRANCGVRSLVDDLVSEDDLLMNGEEAEDMRRLAVCKNVETLLQSFSVDGDEQRQPIRREA